MVKQVPWRKDLSGLARVYLLLEDLQELHAEWVVSDSNPFEYQRQPRPAVFPALRPEHRVGAEDVRFLRQQLRRAQSVSAMAETLEDRGGA